MKISKKRALELSNILKEYSEGKKIQVCYYLDNGTECWKDANMDDSFEDFKNFCKLRVAKQ